MSVRGLIYGGVHALRAALGIGRHHNYRTLEVALVLLLDDAAHHQVRLRQMDVLRRHGLNPGLGAPPHITLKLGFKCRDLAAIASYLDDLAGRSAPVPVTLRDFDHFDEGITFWKVVPDPALEELRRTILADLQQRHAVEPRPLEGDAFRFHVTLTHDLPAKAFEAEREALRGERAEHQFRGRQVSMLVRCNHHWVDFKTVTLGDDTRRPAA